MLIEKSYREVVPSSCSTPEGMHKHSKRGYHISYQPDNPTGFDYFVRWGNPIFGHVVAGTNVQWQAELIAEAFNSQPAVEVEECEEPLVDVSVDHNGSPDVPVVA